MYGQRRSFSPARAFAPGDSGWTVAAGAGVNDRVGSGVRVPITVRVTVESRGAGVPDDVHAASSSASAISAPIARL